MDNNTLLRLVCILIAVIALLVCTSLFFIYTLEEKNAHQRHVIDVLLSTIKRLKVQNDNMKQHTITCLTLLLTLCACSDPQEQPRDGIDLTGAWVLRHVKFPSGTEQDYALDGDGTTKPITADMEQFITNITTAFGHLLSGTALSGNDIQCIVLCAMLVILIVLIVYLSILGRWGMYIGWFFEDVWHWLKRHFTTHPQSFGGEIVRQEENP